MPQSGAGAAAPSAGGTPRGRGRSPPAALEERDPHVAQCNRLCVGLAFPKARARQAENGGCTLQDGGRGPCIPPEEPLRQMAPEVLAFTVRRGRLSCPWTAISHGSQATHPAIIACPPIVNHCCSRHCFPRSFSTARNTACGPQKDGNAVAFDVTGWRDVKITDASTLNLVVIYSSIKSYCSGTILTALCGSDGGSDYTSGAPAYLPFIH